MSIEKNKELVNKFYEAIEREAWGEIAEICHPEMVFYSQIDTPIYGAKGFIASEKRNFDAVPGYTIRTHDLIAEDDKVGAYVVIEGVQTKEMLGFPPRGAKIRLSLFNLLRIADGKIIEKRAHFDVNDIIRQIQAGN